MAEQLFTEKWQSMVFKSFRVRLVIRIIILSIVIGGFTFFIQKQDYYFTSIELLIVIILLIVEMVYFVERGYRQLNNMLQSVKEKDFNISFQPANQGIIFSSLTQLLNELTDSYRKVRIEKEVHYQFLNHIVDQINPLLVCYDNAGVVKLANLSLRKLLKSKDVKNINALAAINNDLPQQLLNLTEGQEFVLPARHEGEILQFALSCSSIKLMDKQYRLVVMHDIRIPLQEHELESYRKLIRVLTHEIMNSVTPILSLSEAMNETLKQPDNSPRLLENLTEQEAADLTEGYRAIEVRSRALMRFVNDFKSLSKLPEPKIQPFSPESLLKPIIALLKPALDAKSIKISMSISKEAKTLHADKDLVEQVLINLMKNSIDALGSMQEPQIDLEVYKSGSKVTVTVTDNGMGIRDENLDKVFVPFYSTKTHGSGIGLSLSQQIMRLHNGSISLKSIEGKGTTVSLIFPHINMQQLLVL